MTTFYGAGPGQDLSEVVDRLSFRNLTLVLGPAVATLIDAVADSTDRTAALRRAVLQTFRAQPTALLSRQDIREICFGATSSNKLKELQRRLALPHAQALRKAQFPPDAPAWQTLLEFYGLDTHGESLFASQPDQELISPHFALFPHQRRVADLGYAAIGHGHGRVVLHMPTGTGKTRTAVHIVSRFLTAHEPCMVIWLAASAELLDQAADAFQDAWHHLGNRAVRMTRLWGSYAPQDYEGTDGLVIAGFQKLRAFRDRNPVAMLRLGASAKLVIVDEAHQAIATTYRDLVNTLADTGPSTALIGLTATPGRTWSDIDADKRLSDFFDNKKITIDIADKQDTISYLVEHGYIARPTFSRLVFEADPELKPILRQAAAGDEYDQQALEALSMQVTRNAIIVREIQRLIAAGHTRIIFFGASVQHATLMMAVLSAIEIESRVVTSSTDATTRRRIIKVFRTPSVHPVVLCNFGVLTMGFDAPNTSACVIARPTKSLVLFSQMVGRATRGPQAGGNKNCAISTVVDIDLPGFGDLAEAFGNWEDVWHDAP